jgi:hypothetical protein
MQARGIRKTAVRIAAMIFGACIITGCATAPDRGGATVDRLYAFNCGESTVRDMSRWTPGVNVGRPGEFSANCYVIRHARDIMVWDTGINDSVAAMPNGFQRNVTAPHYILRKPFRDQPESAGVHRVTQGTGLASRVQEIQMRASLYYAMRFSE